MSTFSCTRCGTIMEAPAPGTRAACPNCGQMFETPADPNEPAPPASRRGRDEGGYASRPPLNHSGLGVASFIIGLVVIILTLLVIILAVVTAASSRPHRGDAAEAMGAVVGIVICGGLVASLVGLGLGVGGLFQEDRNRTFAVIGVVLNGLILVAGAVVVLLGVAFLNRRY
jgi:hypothetical protein